jgi:hypothetical protein
MPYLPSLFMLGNVWGVNLGSLFLFFPRWSLFELMPLMTLGVLLCFQVEYTPGFADSIARTRLYGSIPIGVIYVGSCVWVCSDLLLSLSPNLGLPVAVAQGHQGSSVFSRFRLQMAKCLPGFHRAASGPNWSCRWERSST